MKQSSSTIKEETRATSQHQITIPKKIWGELHLAPGARFQVSLTEDRKILVAPKEESLDLSDSEWKELVGLANDKDNVSRRFKNTKDAITYLKKL